MPQFLQTPPLDDDHVTIVCLHCNKTQNVGRRAMSIPCRFCQRSLCLENLVFNAYIARRVVETCGAITIEEKGNVIVDRVSCGPLVVRGRLKGNVTARGPITVEARAEVRGSLRGPSLIIAPGARLESDCFIAAEVLEGTGS
jgi:hypothetical protein